MQKQQIQVNRTRSRQEHCNNLRENITEVISVDSSEEGSRVSASLWQPEQEIYQETSNEAFENLPPNAEDNVEDVGTLSETKHEITGDATSVEVMNTPLEALEDVADRIFLYCEAVDIMKPLQDDFLGEDLDDTSDSEQDDRRRSLSFNCTVLSPY